VIEVKKFLRRGAGDDTACFEQDDARSKEQSFAKIVGDEDDCFTEAASEGAELTLKLGARNGIKRAKGFVHQQDGRIRGESAGHPDALALAAGKFSWAAMREFGRIEADKMEHFFDASGHARRIPIFKTGNEGNVFGDREMGEKAGLLDDVTNAATEPDGVPFGRGPVLHKEVALCGKQQAINELEEGGLAAAAAAEKNERFTLRDTQGNTRYDHSRRNIVYVIRHIAKLNQIF
jgi:hypothetical protein